MRRFLGLGLGVVACLLTAVSAIAGDAVLTIRGVRELAGVEDAHASRSNGLPVIDLVFGSRVGDSVPVSIPTDGLRFQNASANERGGPSFEFAAPAEGYLVEDGVSTSLHIEGQVAITWVHGGKAKLYDVTLSAEPLGDALVPGELEVRVEGWRSDSNVSAEEPAFYGVFPAVLQAP